ncbi:hypothetical protein LJB95_01790 [Paludibacteraceae bacterium OttesenSCG-928-F17]|nr:hypothetical protein [Paludibacteraceae bacterium OttesenSCG-928-F17]
MKDRLTESFINELHRNIPLRPDLVKEISRILNIEREPASRRLSGSVNFSIDEMGKLAKELNISLDSLLHKNDKYLNVPILLESPWSKNSMSSLFDIISQKLDIINKISTEPYELISIFNSLPIETFIHFPNLIKFMLFKWGHFFVGTNEFYDYSSWEVPEEFYGFKKKVETWNNSAGKRHYVWDVSLIWTLVKEINYLSEMDVINKEDREIIKDELHSMLTYSEEYIKNLNDIRSNDIETYFYMSNIPTGISWMHITSEIGQVAVANTHFSRSGFTTDLKSAKTISDWISSLIKLSTLISGSGHKERRLFFKEQHELVDYLLK